MRLHQVTLSAVTVLVTAWCVTLGTVPAIISVSIAKHVLVAILVMGLGVDEPRRPIPNSTFDAGFTKPLPAGGA